jgi:hypothetical protein
MRAVAFTELEPSSPLAGIGGMSESPAGSSKRGDNAAVAAMSPALK